MSCARYLITQSLLAAWQYNLAGGPPEEFMKVLHREKTEQTQAMKDGIEFERLVWKCACGENLSGNHKWREGIIQAAQEVSGGAYQLAMSKEANIAGEAFLLYGIADFVKSGTIYDVKFSGRCESRGNPNYYLTSPQAPMYLELLPEAKEFVFLISDGKRIFREAYTREDLAPAHRIIAAFADNIRQRGLWETYAAMWRADKERR